MSKELVTRSTDQPTNTLAARDLATATPMIVVDCACLVPITQWADILPSRVPSQIVSKRLVLLWGQIVLLGYVRQPTGQ